ncbi:MAG: hypothetical protein AAB430_00175 [Patescibacteria group bacterium]
MFPAILITGSDQSHRLQAAVDYCRDPLLANPDLLILEPHPSVTIKDIHQLTHFLSRRPYQKPIKIGLIKSADAITLPAQHALLKILEEPPPHSQIILLAASRHQLLDTIVSRCQIINLASPVNPVKNIYPQIVVASLAERINLASILAKDKDTALTFCLNQVKFFPSRCLADTFTYIQANANLKLVMENLLFSYPFAKVKASI